MTQNCRVYTNTKTFEYDLALSSKNAKIMLEILNEYITTNGSIKEDAENYLEDMNNKDKESLDMKKIAEFILKNVGEKKWIGKGLFAQLLVERINENNFEIPNYIKDAIDFFME